MTPPSFNAVMKQVSAPAQWTGAIGTATIAISQDTSGVWRTSVRLFGGGCGCDAWAPTRDAAWALVLAFLNSNGIQA